MHVLGITQSEIEEQEALISICSLFTFPLPYTFSAEFPFPPAYSHIVIRNSIFIFTKRHCALFLGGSHYLLLDRVSQILQEHGHNVTMLHQSGKFLIPGIFFKN